MHSVEMAGQITEVTAFQGFVSGYVTFNSCVVIP